MFFLKSVTLFSNLTINVFLALLIFIIYMQFIRYYFKQNNKEFFVEQLVEAHL